MTRQVELLTASPYIYFNSNPITDPLINNFDLLKEEFFIDLLHLLDKNIFLKSNLINGIVNGKI